MTSQPEEAPTYSAAIGEPAPQTVVALSGEIDCTNADQLLRELTPLFGAAEVETLVFELSGLRFIDSSGLAVLLRAVLAGKHVVLREPSEVLREVVHATGLGEVLMIEAA